MSFTKSLRGDLVPMYSQTFLSVLESCVNAYINSDTMRTGAPEKPGYQLQPHAAQIFYQEVQGSCNLLQSHDGLVKQYLADRKIDVNC